jgi:hypothetical protein
LQSQQEPTSNYGFEKSRVILGEKRIMCGGKENGQQANDIKLNMINKDYKIKKILLFSVSTTRQQLKKREYN